MIKVLIRKIQKAYNTGGIIHILTVCKKSIFNFLSGSQKGDNSDFDNTFGINTSGIISSVNLDSDSNNWENKHAYEPSNKEIFFHLLSKIPLEFPSYTFIDIGSGKGAVLFYATNFNFKEIIGVEYSSTLCDIATSNIESFNKISPSTASMKIVNSDVMDYQLPNGNLLIYLYNPFNEKILVPFIESVIKKKRANSSNIWILYYTPLFKQFLDQFKELETIESCDEFVIYKLIT